MLACAGTLHGAGFHDITDAADAAAALRPLAGQFAYILFAVGLVNASLLSAAILPLATAYNVCEGLGFESGVNKRFSEAPAFYWLYTMLIAVGAGVVLVPKLPLLKVIFIFAGSEWSPAAFRAGIHVDPGQSQGTHGRVSKFCDGECDCLGDQCDCDCDDGCNDLDQRQRSVGQAPCREMAIESLPQPVS